MGSIKDFINGSRRGLAVLIASAALSAMACGSNDKFRHLGYCEIKSNRNLEEICGNPYNEGSCNPAVKDGCDDNCDGSLYDGCDADSDGYCGTDQEIVYEPGNMGTYPFDACPYTFRPCDDSGCIPDLDCNDDDATIHPGATERCNGYDDNCNLLTDESFPEDGGPCGIPAGLDGVGICKSGAAGCSYGSLTCTGAVAPGDAEICDSLDNNCNGLVDEYIAPRFCFYEWLPDESGNMVKVEGAPGTEYVGLCRAGVETCTTVCLPGILKYDECVAAMNDPGVTDHFALDQMCWGAYVGREDVCDGLDNNCSGYPDEDYDIDRDRVATCFGDCDDSDPRRFPGSNEIICNGIDEDCNGLDSIGVDEDLDGYSPVGGTCGPIDCNDLDPEMSPGLGEWCDCKDNNCRDGVDEGMHTTVPIVFIPATDPSGSMYNESFLLETYNSTAPVLDCFSEEYLYVTNVVVDNPPYITGALMSVAEWQSAYTADTPNGTGHWLEPSLNVIAYVSCVKEGMGSHDVCQAIDHMIPPGFRDPDNPILLPGSLAHILLFTDELAQWQKTRSSDPVYNQEEVAQLAADAGIVVDVYTLLGFHNWNVDSWNHGFGYFATLTGGTLYDLTAETVNGTLGGTVACSFIEGYCVEGFRGCLN